MSLTGLSDPINGDLIISTPTGAKTFTGLQSVWGPGYWHHIHSRAKEATTKQLQNEFIEYMEWVKTHLPCSKCRKHCTAYLADNPMGKYLEYTSLNGEKIGLFVWSWKFHNAVNIRLNKPVVDLTTAYNMYVCDKLDRYGKVINEEEICMSGCDNKPNIILSSDNPKVNTDDIGITLLPSYTSHATLQSSRNNTHYHINSLGRHDKYIKPDPKLFIRTYMNRNMR